MTPSTRLTSRSGTSGNSTLSIVPPKPVTRSKAILHGDRLLQAGRIQKKLLNPETSMIESQYSLRLLS